MGDPLPELSIVLPAHNEAENIAPMVAALKTVAAPLGLLEIIFVDDGSTDGTLACIRAAAAARSSPCAISPSRAISVTRRPCAPACAHARGRAVVVMDSDFEHPPELIPELVAQWQAGFKVVAAQRLDDAGRPSVQALDARGFIIACSARSATYSIEPGSADYLLLDRVVVDAVNGFEDQDLFLRGLVRWLGYPLARVTYKPGQRQHGASKYSFGRMVELAVTGIAAHSVRPLRFAIWLALGFRARRIPARDLFDHQLSVHPAHGRRLVVDHGGDRDPWRGTAPGARDHRRICRAHPARDPPAAELHRGGDGEGSAGYATALITRATFSKISPI